MVKKALLIGVSEYGPSLSPLPAAEIDVQAIGEVLKHPDKGGFAEADVLKLSNPDPLQMQEQIETLFSECQRQDLALLYFSGHGIKDESGMLYFATRITRKTSEGELVKATAVPASFVQEIMSNGRSRHQVVILDCCFSGAFAKGFVAKGDGSVDLKDQLNQLGGEGRAVLTASTSTQYAFEQKEAELSTYTRYLIQGIDTGTADRDNDGWISVDELHEYTRRKVQEAAPAMKPEIYAVKEGYKIRIAKALIDDPKVRYRKEVEYWVRGGKIPNRGRIALDESRGTLKLSLEEASAIEAEVLIPAEEYERKLQVYKQEFADAVQRENPLSDETRGDLKRLQQSLLLTDEDVKPIEERILGEIKRPNIPLLIGIKENIVKVGVAITAIALAIVNIPKPEQFTDIPNVPQGKFNYGGSTSWAPIQPVLEPAIEVAQPTFELQYVNPTTSDLGSSPGIQNLLDGKLAFALSSRPVLPKEQDLAQQKGLYLKEISVAKDGLAVAVHPTLNVPGLSIDQLRSIYTGQISNWKAVGGPDRKITPYSRSKDSGTTEVFVEEILGGQGFDQKSVEFVDTTTQALQKVHDNPGGIYYASAAEVVPQCTIKPLPLGHKPGEFVAPYREPFVQTSKCQPGHRNRLNLEAFKHNQYPLTRDLFVVVKQNGDSRDEKAGEAYAKLLLTDEGQRRIREAQEAGIAPIQ